MKFFKTLLTLLLLASFVSSCVTIRGGGAFGRESGTYNNSFDESVSPLVQPGETKSANTSAVTVSNSQTGFYLGLGVSGVDITDRMTFRPELNFIAIKDLNQLQLPVLVGYEVIDNLTAVAGPSFGFLLNQGEGVKSLNYGFDIGAGYEFYENLSGELRYNLGAANLSESDFVKLRLSTFQVGLSYRF